jgi:uncharacterized membrane protein
MKQIEVRVWIDRPAEEVFAYVVDLDRWPEWRSDVVGGELLTDGPIGVGTRARGIGKILGRPFTIDVEVTALEPGIRFGYRPVKGPLQTNNLYTFQTQAGGTLVILTDDIGLNGIFKVFLPVMPSLARSGYRKNLAGLKSALEARSTLLSEEGR